MTGIIPGYWATSGPIYFINQPTSLSVLLVSLASLYMHTHTFTVRVCYSIFAFCSIFISLSNTHTHKLLGYDRATHTLGFSTLFYCLSVMCNQSAAYPCCAVLPSSLKLERESPLRSQPTTKRLPETLVSQPANHTHAYTHKHTHSGSTVCLVC